MDKQCRADVETTAYLEDEARREERAAMFDDLDVQCCDICGDQYPATEFDHEGICLSCEADGRFLTPEMFEDAGGHIHHL